MVEENPEAHLSDFIGDFVQTVFFSIFNGNLFWDLSTYTYFSLKISSYSHCLLYFHVCDMNSVNKKVGNKNSIFCLSEIP